MRRSSRNGLATLLVLAALLLAQSAMAQKRIIYIQDQANQAAYDTVVRALLGTAGATIGGVTISGLGYQVIIVQQLADPAVYTAADGDLLWVSQSIGSANVKNHTADVIPIVNTEQALNDGAAADIARNEMHFGTGEGARDLITDWRIVNNTHPITSIFPLGVVRMFQLHPTGVAQSGAFTGPAAGVTVLCESSSVAADKVLGIADRGATPLVQAGLIAGADPTPARRVCLGFHEYSANNFTTSGAYLLQRVAQWAIGDPVTAGQPVVVTPPAAPSGLTATLAGNGVLLSWTDNSNNETGFKVERKTTATAYVEIAQSPSNSYLDNTVVVGTTYTYRVRATNTVGDSAYSNEVTITALPNLAIHRWTYYTK